MDWNLFSPFIGVLVGGVVTLIGQQLLGRQQAEREKKQYERARATAREDAKQAALNDAITLIARLQYVLQEQANYYYDFVHADGTRELNDDPKPFTPEGLPADAIAAIFKLKIHGVTVDASKAHKLMLAYARRDKLGRDHADLVAELTAIADRIGAAVK